MNSTRITSLILALSLSIFLISCAANVESPPPTVETSSPTPCPIYRAADEGTASLSFCSTPLPSKYAIAESLFIVWLDQYKDKSIPPENRLDDYEVNSVDLIDDPALAQSRGVDFIAKIKYSVKPAVHEAQRWVLVDGVIYNNSDWIWYKGDYVGIKNSNGIYQLMLLGKCLTC